MDTGFEQHSTCYCTEGEKSDNYYAELFDNTCCSEHVSGYIKRRKEETVPEIVFKTLV
jgi:hypothetical protein